MIEQRAEGRGEEREGRWSRRRKKRRIGKAEGRKDRPKKNPYIN